MKKWLFSFGALIFLGSSSLGFGQELSSDSATNFDMIRVDGATSTLEGVIAKKYLLFNFSASW